MLRLLHPFTPFVTEALWGYLKQACLDAGLPIHSRSGWEEALILARWPERMEMESWEDEMIKDFNTTQELIRAIRNLRSDYKIEPARKLHAVFVSDKQQILLESQKLVLCDLAGLDPELTEIRTEKPESQSGMAGLVVNEIEVLVQLADARDDAAEEERLRKELAEVESQIARLEALLASPFAQKAPEKIVQAEREKLETYRVSAEKLRMRLG